MGIPPTRDDWKAFLGTPAGNNSCYFEESWDRVLYHEASRVPLDPFSVDLREDLHKAAKKIKRVRDSFSMPRNEYEVLGALKQRSAKLGRPGKKSELLRAGLKLLAALNDKALLAALQALPATRAKAGTPKKG